MSLRRCQRTCWHDKKRQSACFLLFKIVRLTFLVPEPQYFRRTRSITLSLRWRHNGHDGVSNHQPHDYLLNRLFRRRSKKTSKLRVTGLCGGNSPGTGEFPAQRASNAENVSIWWRHHVMSWRPWCWLGQTCPPPAPTDEHGFTWTPAWINHFIHCNVWDEIMYPFPKFNGYIVDVWEGISSFIPHFTGYVITYLCCGKAKPYK